MKTPLQFSLVAAALALAGGAGAAGWTHRAALRSRSPTDQAYHRVMSRALERTQARLERGLNLWTDHSSWDDPWVVRTDHYEVRTIDSWYIGAAAADLLEEMRQRWCDFFATDFVPVEHLKVILQENMAAYNQFGETHGAEHSSRYASFYSTTHPERPVVTYYHPNPVQRSMWVSHAALHQFLAEAFPQAGLPPWLEEGLATYFELLCQPQYGAAGLRRLGGSESFATILNLPLGSYDQRHFLQLGLMVRYLHEEREETRGDGAGSFVQLVRQAVAGGPNAAQAVDQLQQRLLQNGALEADFLAWLYPEDSSGE